MTFSASPLTPEAGAGSDTWLRTAERVVAAVGQAAALTQQRLADVEVDVAVRFRPLRLPSSRLGDLAVGDVVPLGHRTTTPLAVTSAATTFASAVPGTSGAKLAVLIVPSP